MNRTNASAHINLRLVGVQSTAVEAHHPQTSDAVLMVRVGKTLLYLHSPETAGHFLSPWSALASKRAQLPRYADRRLTEPVDGMSEPGIVLHAHGHPPTSALLIPPRGSNPPWARVSLGRLVFEARDQVAFTSCMLVLRQAVVLSRTTFPPALHMPAARARPRRSSVS